MKKIIFTLAIALTSFAAFAQEVPAYLKDAVITVKLKNGKTYEYSANEYAVVRRGAKKKAEALAPLAQAPSATPARKKNRLTVLGGVGFDGNKVTQNATSATIEDKREPVFGFSLSRDVGNDFSITGGALTNSTFLLGVGKDF